MTKNKKVGLAKGLDEKIERQVEESTKSIVSFMLFCNVDHRSKSIYVFLALAQDSLHDLISSGHDIRHRRLYVIALACILGLMKFSEKELANKGTPEATQIGMNSMLMEAAQWMEWQAHLKPSVSILEKLGIKKQKEKDAKRELEKKKKEDEEMEKRVEHNKNLLTKFFSAENKI